MQYHNIFVQGSSNIRSYLMKLIKQMKYWVVLKQKVINKASECRRSSGKFPHTVLQPAAGDITHFQHRQYITTPSPFKRLDWILLWSSSIKIPLLPSTSWSFKILLGNRFSILSYIWERCPINLKTSSAICKMSAVEGTRNSLKTMISTLQVPFI